MKRACTSLTFPSTLHDGAAVDSTLGAKQISSKLAIPTEKTLAAAHLEQSESEDADISEASWMDLLVFPPGTPTHKSDSVDDYDGIEDGDWAQLLSEIPRSPPTTVVRNLERNSRHDDNFDPTLQFSPANATPGGNLPTQSAVEELLDEDVDWAMVLSIADKTGGSSHTVSTGTIEDRSPVEPVPPSQTQRPFVRPPVPAKVHDRTVIPGMSSSVVLRVCFRIGELLSLNARYSTRESLSRTQHFQFMDLFTDRQPFPAGTMKNWKPGSIMDQRAQGFLEGGGQKLLCRVVCTMRKQELSGLGWVLDIVSIEQTNWEEITWVRKIVARDDTDVESQRTGAD
ncbi:hypothetical protein B0T11DRAFT_275359 [Plectosphaerella cucumerina]|uniref:Uncharacterized protein n=1 Tax=Plectosphaerella cucumerina TaxID=40658 RepID=A0A8K0TMX7_9PEZI|nr:hypothetical protein B0T11DRAFT_275359 [Plectosphaerella cucumerina]